MVGVCSCLEEPLALMAYDVFLELDVARGGHREAEHDDLKRDALN